MSELRRDFGFPNRFTSTPRVRWRHRTQGDGMVDIEQVTNSCVNHPYPRSSASPETLFRSVTDCDHEPFRLATLKLADDGTVGQRREDVFIRARVRVGDRFVQLESDTGCGRRNDVAVLPLDRRR